ncbi:glycerol kinase GlpK [Haloferula rosea]|uniref:Glycerol kinase n=1 Tax=Haloferula rosea TaxID=490093 RepID=A0A934RE77_9BACT|nr:glycerol kinase GlpK [Haloferula rosea]MBK1828043.1 glycerol kinase GlpK [Haloferula rosea]
MSRFILSFDQGTTSSRAILFNREGEIRGIAQREFEQIFPQPGWVEHDAEEIWASQSGVADEVMSNAGISADDIAAIGITNQRETTVVWDRSTGRPIHRAIVWQDRRTSERIDRLKGGEGEALITRRTGLVPDAYFAGSKIEWILDHVEGARARAERGELAFGTIDCWLVYRLTGGSVHVTDASNAARTMLYNIETCAWDEDLMKVFRVPASMLPEVRSSSEVYGEVSAGLACRGVPIAGMAGDQNAALFGQLCHEPGNVKNTYGTGCFMLMNSGDQPRKSSHRLLSTIAWQFDGKMTYALEGSVFVGGAVVQWLRDGLKMIEKSADIQGLAGSVADSGGVYFVPAFAGLGAPHWDQYARGTIFGLTRGTTSAHIARAAVESMAFQSADLLDAMVADADAPIPELRVDGGATRDEILLQFQSDVLQMPIVRPTMVETTALGAAYLAGLATGFWGSVDELVANWKVDRVFEPRMPPDQVAEKRANWNKAVRRSLGWLTDKDGK